VNIVLPEAVGFSAERLRRIEAAVQRYVDAGQIAGTLAMVARHGQIAYSETCGMMDVASDKPMRLDTIFRIYSMSKPITSVAALMLYEEGHFRLTDPVADYIPAFGDTRVLVAKTESGVVLADPLRPVTIRDLMTHTAGLAYGLDQSTYVDKLYVDQIWNRLECEPEIALEELIEIIARQPLAFQPGSAWKYSIATDVLGYLVQVVSGQPFDVFLKERVFAPLEMIDTAFYVPPDKVERFATNYGPDGNGGLKAIDLPRSSRFTRRVRHPSGGGGLLSTATDYMRFAQMLLNRGELDSVRLLGPKTVELMTANHLLPGQHPWEDKSFGFGLGVGVVIDLAQSASLGSVGSYGWGGAANTRFWIDPHEDLIGLLMLQFMPNGTYPIVDDFVIAVYQALVD
jgi:CubicO group peptidase (beta-lactamase class C family)